MKPYTIYLKSGNVIKVKADKFSVTYLKSTLTVTGLEWTNVRPDIVHILPEQIEAVISG